MKTVITKSEDLKKSKSFYYDVILVEYLKGAPP